MILISVKRLSLWAEGDETSIASDDPRALEILTTVTEKILDATNLGEDQLGGLSDKDKRTLARVCITVAKRVWVNPHNHTADGGIGPIGGDSYSAEAYAGLAFTEAELLELAKVETDGAGDTGPFWSVPFRGGKQRGDGTIYLHEDEFPLTADLIPYGAEIDAGAFGTP